MTATVKSRCLCRVLYISIRINTTEWLLSIKVNLYSVTNYRPTRRHVFDFMETPWRRDVSV